MVKKRFKRMEVPNSFRRLVFDLKSEQPDKKIPEIIDEFACKELEKRKKNEKIVFKYL